MKAALYARAAVNTGHGLETQLSLLRNYCQAMGWEIYAEYLDLAPARGQVRPQWQKLLQAAANQEFGAVVVLDLERACRSAAELDDCLSAFRAAGVALHVLRHDGGPLPAGVSMPLPATESLAPEPASQIAAADNRQIPRQGRKIGRPGVMDRLGFNERFRGILEGLNGGTLSRSQVARQLGIGYATLKSLLDQTARDAGERM